MPVHDWSRVEAGVFHDFHNAWIAELRNRMNAGLLPDGFYALSEQHAGKYIPDIISLLKPTAPAPVPISGAVTVASAPPKVRRKFSLTEAIHARRKTLAIRHVSGHQLIAVIEIVSPANKDREEGVAEFLDKIEDFLAHGVHVLLVDVFAPGRHDPQGMHGALWKRLGDEPENPPSHEPCELTAYVADSPIWVYQDFAAFGSKLPDMPLFLDTNTYVYTPLEAAYDVSWRGTPSLYRELLEQPRGPIRRKTRK